jgi:HAD superfamily hydrolase (TIGR01509 family)
MAAFDGVIFDMDGTLIEQEIDFAAIRAVLEISPRDGILEAIEQMPPDDAAHAGEILLNHEMEAAKRAELIDGARTLLARVREANLRTALLTRNAGEVMRLIMSRFALEFDLAWSRENGPIKPQPDGVLRACREMGVTPERTCCVGDFHYDIQAANAAGCVSILLDPEGVREFAEEADHVIRRLDQLPAILAI